ncbi:MAG: hypothetical protein HYV09_04365 [Deltaproteobacteria bacterium]|nr:hypothetical protein [Deltaproteobacteria bacterium]
MIDELAPGVSRVSRRDPSGWSVDMIVARLDDGALVFSPTWVGDATAQVVERLGAPRVLVSPNHFHHLSLPRYRARWPEATAIASDGARPRLLAKGHQGVRALDEVSLPGHVRLLPARGTKTGETWLAVDDTLVVCDSFFHIAEPVSGVMGVALRALRTAPGLQLGRTFEWLAVADRATYRAWALETLARERPKVIAFSHGAPLRDADGWKRCSELVERHLG